MNKLNLLQKILRWKTSRTDLLQQLDSLQEENDRLRTRIAALLKAKDLAERQAEERRREKEVLRARLNSQKKATEQTELISEQLNAKITELRNENDQLRLKKAK